MSDYPKPSLTADVVVFAIDEGGAVRALFIRRAHPPFQGSWALPGGFCEPHETVEACARRELEEETGLSAVEVEQLATFSKPGRDPRGWTVTVAHVAEVPHEAMRIAKGGDDAAEARWLKIESRGAVSFVVLDDDGGEVALAFDHHDILEVAIQKLRGETRSRVISERLRECWLAQDRAAREARA